MAVAQSMSEERPFTIPALAGNGFGPPDARGVAYRSRVADVLIARGLGDLAGLRWYLQAMGCSSPMAARIEGGVDAPSADYRRKASEVLGVPEGLLFERLPPADNAPDASAPDPGEDV